MVEEIVASGHIPLKCHIIDARISTAMYKYFRPVLLHVKSKGGDGATSKSLSEDLFVGMESVSRRLLEICADEKMVERLMGDDRFVITDRGREAIDNGVVLVRDTCRMWKIYYTDCKLVPAMHKILILERGSGEAAYQKGEDGSVRYTSCNIRSLKGDTMTPLLGKNTAPFRIEELAEHEKIVKTDVRVRLHLHLAKDKVWLYLTACKNNKKIRSEKINIEKTYGSMVEDLLKNDYEYYNKGRWDEKACRLEVQFNKTELDERTSMRRTLVFEQPEIYGCKFDKGLQIRVDIWPEDEYEARKWARWLVGRRIEKQISNNVYKKIKNEITETFPEFDIDLKDGIVEYFEDD